MMHHQAHGTPATSPGGPSYTGAIIRRRPPPMPGTYGTFDRERDASCALGAQLGARRQATHRSADSVIIAHTSSGL
jgi:hypothetical protein